MDKIKAFKYDSGNNKLEVLNQTRLPQEEVFVSIEDCDGGFKAIRDMLVRGAPCIAAVGCLSIVNDLNKRCSEIKSIPELLKWFNEKMDFMITSRPTAVNLARSLESLRAFIEKKAAFLQRPEDLCNEITSFCNKAIEKGVEANKRLATFGADEFISRTNHQPITVLTHCNTGALATVGHGTALGVIRTVHQRGLLSKAYCTETRPFNQGSRLTAWELVTEDIPATLIGDNMVAYLMSTKRIDYVVVGADRVAANGDTVNKIGTLQIAITAKHYGVPFYVASPSQSIDLKTCNTKDTKIEFRPPEELRIIRSAASGAFIELAPEAIDIWNPCFDVTPAELINGIITEFGVCEPSKVQEFLLSEKVSGLRSSDGEALF